MFRASAGTAGATSGLNRGAAVAIGVQQLKRTQMGSSLQLMPLESSSSAQRAVQRRITHVGERGGSKGYLSERSERSYMYLYKLVLDLDPAFFFFGGGGGGGGAAFEAPIPISPPLNAHTYTSIKDGF